MWLTRFIRNIVRERWNQNGSLCGSLYSPHPPVAVSIMMSRWISLVLLVLTLSQHSAKADSVSVSKECFDINETIQVSFEKDNDANRGSAWIGIYATNRLNNNTQNLPIAEIWVNLCGSATCNAANNPIGGSVTFQGNADQNWRQSWPLTTGTYRAVLTHGDDDASWPVLAMSPTFRVGCDSNPAPVTIRLTTGTPTRAPVRPPTQAPTDMRPVIANARSDIEAVIASSPLMVGKFLRLAFHDCVEICDGCVDMTFLDNKGLQMPIDALQPIANRYASQGLSRTDIWMLAAVVAADVSEVDTGVDFPFQWIGRETCDQINNGNCGLNSQGNVSSCTATGGPHHELCHGDTAGTNTIDQFMQDAFGFNAQQTAAIMGAHTVGAMRHVNVGFDGRHGWDLTNDELDQGYYLELVGDDAPVWTQVLRSNSDVEGMPPRFQFQATVDNITMTMLNSDIAMVRNLVEGENLMPDGNVTCNFSGRNACSDRTPFIDYMKRYALSRFLFLNDFRDALDMMIENGYTRGRSCDVDEVCRLTRG